MLLRLSLVVVMFVAAGRAALAQSPARSKRPNVIVIITDDQGYGDLGIHGNPVIKTPNIDKFAKQSVRMKNFYVAPVCSPTRSSLMTGRYNYRTGVVDTFVGRSMMFPDEVTLAEILRTVGYHTGIFGKWHLGDNYPMRAMDQGFEEALVLKGGGIGQPSDPPGGESYFNPILQHNGKSIRKEGYCTDIFTDAALDFVGKHKDQPFFCYLAFNCPHTPLEVPKKYADMYEGKLQLSQFPAVGRPVEGKVNLDDTAKIYGMITNIDDNVGRLLAKLQELGIADDTIVIFMTDNGPQQPRYNAGLRGRKGTTFEGGTRVPFFVRWPARLRGDREIDRIAAHIDVTPTLAAACGAKMPEGRKIDGMNLLPLWLGAPVSWPDRSLFFQWHRGDVPQMYRACAVRTQRYRLVQPEGVPENVTVNKPRFMLFDIEADPYESRDVAEQQPETVAQLKKQYEEWFKDVASTRNFAVSPIHIGSSKEDPVVLTRQDWRSPQTGWTPKSVGYWQLKVEKGGAFDVRATFPTPPKAGSVIHFELGENSYKKMVSRADALTASIDDIAVSAGPLRLKVWLAEGDTIRGPRFVEVVSRALKK